MKILCVLRAGYARVYESTLRELAARGHTIELCLFPDQGPRTNGDAVPRAIEQVVAASGISVSRAQTREPGDAWHDVAHAMRLVGDLGRFLHPRFEGASSLVERPRRMLVEGLSAKPGWVCPASARAVNWVSHRRGAWLSNGLVALSRVGERLIPRPKVVVELLRECSPDVVMVTPLVDLGSDQVDYVKAARSLRIPCIACVASWDNLTNKGLLRGQPDCVAVWNEAQRREAVELHAIPAAHVVVTGAPRFDAWFDRSAAFGADELRRRVGLDPDRPHLVYTCSSRLIAPDEVSFVTSWIQAVRESPDPALCAVGILIRPHPEHGQQWLETDLMSFGNVSVWPRGGAFVEDEVSRIDFFDSLVHSSAVVGIATSAQIEAAILGKSVLTITDPKCAEALRAMPHYRYLLVENGGFVHESTTMAEHVRQLASILRGELDDRALLQRFVGSFVRPLGLETPATSILADTIERLGLQGPRNEVCRNRGRTSLPYVKSASRRHGREEFRSPS